MAHFQPHNYNAKKRGIFFIEQELKKMKSIQSYSELCDLLKCNEQSFLLLYKKGSENSDCAYTQLSEAANETEEKNVYAADVNSVRDIHTEFNITTAPSLLVFNNSILKNTYKGCNGKDFFKGVIESHVFSASGEEGSSQPSVEVYSTPTCSWCNKLKSYLKKNRISFNDINIAADQSLAEDLVRQTGQQGVPQTNIGGEWIVGFDKKRIDELLNINV